MKRRQRGEGTIERAPGADGAVRFRARMGTGAERLDFGTFATPEEADVQLRAARLELLSGDAIGVTLRTWAARQLDRREVEGYRSVGDDRSRWRTHIEKDPIADLPLVEIARADVFGWLDRLCSRRAAGPRGKGQRISRSTAQNVLNLLRGLFAGAVERQVLDANPAEGVHVPRRVQATHEPWTYLELHEIEAVLACEAIPEMARLWIQFAIGTGLREGEQFNLLLRDMRVDGDAPEIVVRYGSREAGPKNTSGRKTTIRHVPLFGIGLAAARRWLELLPSYCPANELGLVFPGPTGARRQKGKHLHGTRKVVVAGKTKVRPVNLLPGYLEAAGIVTARRHDGMHVRWHDFRHTAAAALVSGYWGRRWSLEEVRPFLGHRSITTTERYAHLAATALRRAAAETEAAHKPGVSPAAVASAPPANLRNPLVSALSHLRDLNSRPTVYEDAGNPSNFLDLAALKARGRADDAAAALADLASGRSGRAIAAIEDLIDDAGELEAPARVALADVIERRRFGRMITMLEQLLDAGAADDRETPATAVGAR